jgi:hypothetical protein
MENESDIFKMDPIYLKASVIEPILVACIDKASFTDIHGYVQRVLPDTTEGETKEHLFYLISGSFINYTGKSMIYSTSQNGIDLLAIIYSQIDLRIVDYSDLKVKVE